MATVTLKNHPYETIGELPPTGNTAPKFSLCAMDLSELDSQSLAGKRIILNIFPSIDTPTCASSVREFNHRAASLNNVVVVCVSADLPFALGRFCGAEGISNVLVASSFRSSFGNDYGVTFSTGPLAGLLSRAIVIIDSDGAVIYTEQVAETSVEPNYEAAIATIT